MSSSEAIGRRLSLEKWEAWICWSIILLFAAFSIAVVADRHFIGSISPLFWDLPVYTTAVDLLATGQNPYDSNLLHQAGVASILHFTSPPAVYRLFELIANSPLHAIFKPALVLLHLVAILGIPLMLGRLFFGSGSIALGLAVGAFLVLFATAGLGAFGAMNNGTSLYFFIIAGLVPGLTRQRWTGFHIAVIVATIFKPFYIFFWVIPVLAHGFSWRQLFSGMICALVAVASYALAAVLDPALFNNWLNNILTQTVGIGDLGTNLFGVVHRLVPNVKGAPYAVHFALMAGLGLVLLTTRLRGPRLWASLIAAVIFMNPRVMGYDMAIASIPIAYLGAMLLPGAITHHLRLAASTLAIGTTMLVLSYRDAFLSGGLVFPAVVSAIILLTALREGFSLSPLSLYSKPKMADSEARA